MIVFYCHLTHCHFLPTYFLSMWSRIAYICKTLGIMHEISHWVGCESIASKLLICYDLPLLLLSKSASSHLVHRIINGQSFFLQRPHWQNSMCSVSPCPLVLLLSDVILTYFYCLASLALWTYLIHPDILFLLKVFYT